MANKIANGRLGLGLVTVLLILAVAASVFFVGKHQGLMHLGLDLQGGVSVSLEAQPGEGGSVTQDDMDKLSAIMENRVNEFGVAEPLIQQEGSDRLIVELAGVNDSQQAINMLGKTAKLEFLDPNAEEVLLDGNDLKDAYVSQVNNAYVVALEFTSEGAEKFAEATTKYVGQGLPIRLDDAPIVDRGDGSEYAPRIKQAITDGKAVIDGMSGYDECAELASLLRGGALPVDVEILEVRVVGPQLGSDSLSKSYVAILYGIAAVFLFMIIYYRLPGFLTCLSLLLYGLILFWVQSLINATLTLPGIAAFLLSMGMAVDANIIIFERVKDELRQGKTLPASVNSGFKRAFKAILDANVTTLIATVVLFYFGVSSIRGFAITLSIGVLASMFTAIVFTRFLLKMCVEDKVLGKRGLYRS